MSFDAFAEHLYAAAPDIYIAYSPSEATDRFMLPALYGGDSTDHGEVGAFDHLVVLEAPSPSFTRRYWKDRDIPCQTVDEAIRRHRQIFFEWACLEPQAGLFRVLIQELSTAAEFFRRLYITDIWKDAGFQINRKRNNPAYKEYWRDVLRTEFSSVRAKSIIFVGSQARDNGWDLAPPGTRRYHVPFPKRTRLFAEGFAKFARALASESECRADLGLDNRPDTIEPRATFHAWTLNDSVNLNVYNYIAFTARHIEMSIFYQSSRGEDRLHVADSPLDLQELLTNGLARQSEKGIFLRFVHDTTDHGIYIQLNRRSPRRLFGQVPVAAFYAGI